MSAWDAKITRVDRPEPGLLSLSLRLEGRNACLVAVTLPGKLDLGIVDQRPRGATADTSTTQLRHHLEGGRVEEVALSRREARITIERGGLRRTLVAAPSKPYGAWWLCEPTGEVVVRSPGAPGAPPDADRRSEALPADTLRARGDAVLDAHRVGRIAQLQRALDRRTKKLAKKRDAMRADLRRAEQAEQLHEQASLLLAYQSEIPADATSFEAPSWEDPSRSIRVELDPAMGATEIAQALFAKSKKLKRGLDVVPARLRAVESELSTLDALRHESSKMTAAELATRLRAAGVTIVEPVERERERRRAGARLPFRQFVTVDGSQVLVGRGAADNDRLTLRVAKPHDLWLHARGVTGAHVVVRLAKGKSCGPETLADAATLAAHFSDLRGESIVDVLYTPRRFVRKRKGSPVGSVTLEREKVIAVRLEDARLRRLLDGEVKLP